MSDLIDRYAIPEQTTDFWPLNLLAAVERTKGELTMKARPSDFDASLAYVLNLLTERERRVLLMRFAERMPLEAVGKEFNVTRERIRQVEEKALRKMQHPNLKRFLKHGVSGVIALQSRAAEEARAQGVQEGRNIPLADLDLSVRTYHCLLRAGVQNSGDILAMDEGRLMGVRNLGRKSMQEIIDRLEHLGFDCEHLGGKTKEPEE